MQVTVIDYGIGNLYSVQRAFESCGAEVVFVCDADGVRAARRLILPGVGAFADGMRGLRERGLVEPLRSAAQSGTPLLAICLGMQMLASSSEEFGQHEGLGLIPGRVQAVPSRTVAGEPQKIPHIGWNALQPAPQADWQSTPLATTPPGTPVYLVHSYSVVTDEPSHTLAQCEYGGHQITTAIRRDSIVGFQFHPEKSSAAGLRILRTFLQT